MESRAAELFKDLDQNFICSICLNVMGNPYDTPCHHTYCFDCINEAIKANGLCPECRQSVAVKRLHPSPFKFKSVLHNLVTICDSESEGKKCEWTGVWSNLDSHLKNECAFVKTLCTFGCGKEILRCNLPEHESTQCPNRNTPCMYCKEEINKLSVKKHFEECLEATVKCKCKAKFLRKELADHQASVCPETVLTCMFSWAGCTDKCERKFLADHLQTLEAKHVDLVSKKLTVFQKINSDLSEAVKEGKKEIQSLKGDLSSAQNENAKFGEDASNLKKLNTTLIKQFNEEKESREKVVTDLTQTKSQLEQANKKAEQANKEAQEHLQEIESLGKRNKELETALFKLQEDVKLSQSRNSEMLSKLQTDHQQHQQEAQKMLDEFGKLSQKYQHNKENFDKQNSDSMKALMGKEKELKELQSANKSLQSEIETLKFKYESQLNEFKKRFDSTTQANETKMKSIREELSNLQEKNFDLLLSKTNLLAEQKQERESLENQKSDLQTMLSEMGQELERMRSFSHASQPQEEQTQHIRFNLKYLLGVSLLLWIYIAIKV